MNPRVHQSNDTVWIYTGLCKTLKTTILTGQKFLSDHQPVLKTTTPLLTVHGNIMYDYQFRSFTDTPYYQKEFRQHTIRTSLNLTIKDHYPLRVNFVIRKSNSPYFRNYFDGGFLFDRFAYYKKIKQQLLAQILKKVAAPAFLEAAKKTLQTQLEKFSVLKARLSTNGLAQKIIEEREKLYFQAKQLPAKVLKEQKIPGLDSLKEDIMTLVTDKQKELDSLQNKIEKLQHQIDSVQQSIASYTAKAQQAINKAKNPADLAKIAAEYGIENKKQKFEKLLTGLKNIGIGRSLVDFSELTAKNVSLTGINFEYNSGIYLAAAAGRIDYGFRDFFGKNNRLNQHLFIGRIGIGDLEKKAIIFSVFGGKKYNYGGLQPDTVSGEIPLTGFSIESIVKKDENTSFSAEIAKSTKPFAGNNTGRKTYGGLFDFSEQSNMAFSIKGQTVLHETKTRLSGLFRKMGNNYQSFSLFTYNTDQTAWMGKLEQALVKDKINISGIIRKNDFVNPFTEKTYKTSTVFGGIQMGVRFRKWPSLNISYLPGSQIYIINRDRIRENVYYILNGTLVYQYNWKGLQFASSAFYNNYTTKGTDSGFINYSGKNYMFSQSLISRKTQWQANLIYTDQEKMKFYTAEANAELSIGTVVRLGSGIKYNKIISGDTYWGGRALLVLDFKLIGNLQLQYEKSFLPTIQQTLFPVEIGRVTWFKNF